MTALLQRNYDRFDECVLFKSNKSYASRVSESYLELGELNLFSQPVFFHVKL